MIARLPCFAGVRRSKEIQKSLSTSVGPNQLVDDCKIWTYVAQSLCLSLEILPRGLDHLSPDIQYRGGTCRVDIWRQWTGDINHTPYRCSAHMAQSLQTRDHMMNTSDTLCLTLECTSLPRTHRHGNLSIADKGCVTSSLRRILCCTVHTECLYHLCKEWLHHTLGYTASNLMLTLDDPRCSLCQWN